MAPVDQLTSLHFDPLFLDRLAFVTRAGHPLVDTRPGLSAISSYPVILPLSNAVVRPVVEVFLTSRGIGIPDDRIETTAASVAMGILKQTDAIWMISRGVAEAAVADGRLALLQLDTGDTIGSIGMTRRGDEDSCPPELTLLFDILRANATDRATLDQIP